MAQSKSFNLLPRENLLQSHYFALQTQHFKEKSYAVTEEDNLWLNYDEFACNHICVKDLNELRQVNITDLKIGINYGVKLVVKSIVKPRGFMNITTILEDKDKNAINCAIYNYTQIMQIPVNKLDSVLPIHTTLIIKEPYTKVFQDHSPAIRIDNPHTNVVLMSDVQSQANINIGTMSVTELKEFGNKYYKIKKYDIAIRYYSAALATQNQEKIENKELISKILNNKALCYIRLREFQRAALAAADALSMNKNWRKAKWTLCTALVGNKRFDKALEILKEANTNQNDKLFKILEKTIKRKILETSKEFVHQKPKTLQLWQSDTDFVSDSIAVAWINNEKGRGFIATKNIKKGQLLVREQCFAVGLPVKNWRNYPLKREQRQFETDSSLPMELMCSAGYSYEDMCVTQDYIENRELLGQNMRSVGQYNLLCDLMKKYANGTEVDRYKVSLLFDGSERQQIIPCMNVLKYDELPEVKGGDRKLSVRRLMQITEKNSFNVPVGPLRSNEPWGSGIFIVSSFFNHCSKDNNCDNRAYPLKQIIFAVRDIKKGEELTITYYDEFKNNCPFNYNDD